MTSLHTKLTTDFKLFKAHRYFEDLLKMVVGLVDKEVPKYITKIITVDGDLIVNRTIIKKVLKMTFFADVENDTRYVFKETPLSKTLFKSIELCKDGFSVDFNLSDISARYSSRSRNMLKGKGTFSSSYPPTYKTLIMGSDCFGNRLNNLNDRSTNKLVSEILAALDHLSDFLSDCLDALENRFNTRRRKTAKIIKNKPIVDDGKMTTLNTMFSDLFSMVETV